MLAPKMLAPRVLALLLSVMIVGYACSSDDDPPPATEATAAATTAAPPTTQAPPPTTTLPPTTTAPPPPTTTAPPPTTAPAVAAPIPTAVPEREVPHAVEGVLLEGQTPEGYDSLLFSTNVVRTEVCPGTLAFGGLWPVAHSEAQWAIDPLTGPIIDVFVTRFESAEMASEALNKWSEDLIACGEFPEPESGALGSFSVGEDPAVGDESFGINYTATFQGLPINRYGVYVRVGDSLYVSGATFIFVEPEKPVVLEALDAILGL